MKWKNKKFYIFIGYEDRTGFYSVSAMSIYGAARKAKDKYSVKDGVRYIMVRHPRKPRWLYVDDVIDSRVNASRRQAVIK